MGRGVKIGGSRGPKWRLDPLFGAIFGHFEAFWALLGPFLTTFGHFEQLLVLGQSPRHGRAFANVGAKPSTWAHVRPGRGKALGGRSHRPPEGKALDA